MSRRARAIAFFLASLFAAAAAAAIANGYRNSVVRGYGQLRPVLVASVGLRAGETIDPETAAAGLDVRRVPIRFAPPGVLAAPAEAVGLKPLATVPAGSYLIAAQLRSASPAAPQPGLGHGRRPVEIAVSGAGALNAFGGRPGSSRVDVVVTAEPTGSGSGRTYIAAPAVPLLGLVPGAEGSGTAIATLGLTRAQALRLIAAESFARQVTVIPR